MKFLKWLMRFMLKKCLTLCIFVVEKSSFVSTVHRINTVVKIPMCCIVVKFLYSNSLIDETKNRSAGIRQ